MIYCVEDEKNIRELLVYTLETTGFTACLFFRYQKYPGDHGHCKRSRI